MKVLKGHTKIELTNVKTGQKQVIEDGNLVTNAMAKMFEQTPHCRWNPATNPFTNVAPLIDRFCGGILLFRDTIEEDPDNYFTPDGNEMVGNARVNYASAQDVPEFGAYNAEESSWNPETGERKYVYDFSTSKGNGTISCVALTNPFVGYYGLGNTSGKKEALKVENVNYGNVNMTPSTYFWSGSDHWNSSFRSTDVKPVNPIVLFANYEENCVYAFDIYAFHYNSSHSDTSITSGKLKLYKYYFPFSSFDPMKTACSERLWELLEVIELEVPSEITTMTASWTMYSQICHDDAIYIVFTNKQSQTISAGAEFKIWKISYDLTTSEVIPMVNNTGSDICGGTQNYGSGSYNYITAMAVHNGYLVCSSTTNDGKVFKIKLSDPTDVTEFTNLCPTNTSSYCSICFYKLGGTIYGYDSREELGWFALNLKTNTVAPVNGFPQIRGYTANGAPTSYLNIPVVGKEQFIVSASYGYMVSSATYLIYDPFMLSTINNLPEPVVKTADLAMKIIYTLTLADDEQEAGDS